jgi:hypothetical protein
MLNIFQNVSTGWGNIFFFSLIHATLIMTILVSFHAAPKNVCTSFGLAPLPTCHWGKGAYWPLLEMRAFLRWGLKNDLQ